MIKYYVRSDSTYVFPQYSDYHSFIRELMDVARQASADRNEAGAAHAVYAVKIYGEDGALDHVNIYSPAVLMTEQEFEERTAAEYKAHPGCVIYASHAYE